MAWVAVILFVVSLVVNYKLSGKTEPSTPPSVDDLQIPTAEAGREIPVLFGRKKIKGFNVIWYGDVRVEPIKKKGGKK